MKKALRKPLLWLALIVAVLGTTTALIVATETGTRWVLEKSLGDVTGLDVHSIRGTLLTNVEFGRIDYSNSGATLTLVNTNIDFAWSRTSMRQVALRQLSVGEFRYESLTPASTEPTPFEISIPDVPISILVDAVVAHAVVVNGGPAARATARIFELNGDSLSIVDATANFSNIETSVRDLQVYFDDDLSVKGRVEWIYYDGEWSGRAAVDGSLRQLRFQHELLTPHVATATGSLELLQQTTPVIDAIVQIDDWRYGTWAVADAELIINGTKDAYSASASATVANEQLFSTEIQAEGNGSITGLESVEVTARSPRGLMGAVGSVAWAPKPELELKVTGKSIDLADFLPVAPGSLDTTFSLTASSPTNYVVNVTSLTGTYNNQNIQALGHFSNLDATYICTDCELTVGQNRFSIDGSLSDRTIAASFAVAAKSLDHLWPELDGSITGDGVLRGSVELPVLTVNATGNQIAWRDWRIEKFALQSRTSELDNIDLQFDVNGLVRGDAVFGRGRMRAEGELDAIDTHIDWWTDELRASTRATIGIGDDNIVGMVSRANIIERYTGTWKLSGPLEFSAGNENLQVAANSWVNGDALLQIDRLVVTGNEVGFGATLGNIPLALANNALPDNIRLGGFANADISLQRTDGNWAGDLHWTQNNTDILLSKPGVQPIQIDAPVFSFDAHLDAAGARARAEIEVAPGLDGLLELSVNELSPDAELRAQLQVSGTEWDWIPLLLPEIDDVTGEITANIFAAGSPKMPRLHGDIRWQQGRLAIPSLNAPLTDIDVTVTAHSDDDANITGKATAGGGTLLMDGRLEDIAQSSRSFSVDIKGDSAELLNWPDYQLSASPDLNISGNTGVIVFTGKLGVEKAEITVRELPEGAVRPSADAVVAGETREIRSEILLSGDVDVALSQNVHIDAFGLDSRLEGKLRFSQQETGKPQAVGELQLKDGVFGAYGQELEIEKGTLIFTGPIDDPIVNVRAIREIDTPSGAVTVGIELRGRAKSPSSTIFSDPAMSETETLSYLVLGRSLQTASTDDGTQVADAAFALGVRQAALITNQIGLSLGLDELAIEGSNQSTVSLVAGKQINSRLYARYAYGVFARIGNLLLRYQLSERFTIEVGAGDSQSMDLLYIIEKK